MGLASFCTHLQDVSRGTLGGIEQKYALIEYCCWTPRRRCGGKTPFRRSYPGCPSPGLLDETPRSGIQHCKAAIQQMNARAQSYEKYHRPNTDQAMSARLEHEDLTVAQMDIHLMWRNPSDLPRKRLRPPCSKCARCGLLHEKRNKHCQGSHTYSSYNIRHPCLVRCCWRL